MRFRTLVASLESLDRDDELIAAREIAGPSGTIHVLATMPSRSRSEDPAAELRLALDRLRTMARRWLGEVSAFLHVRRGDRAEETVRLAVECNADLIVMGAFEPGSPRDASRVIDWAACSVMVVEPSRERAEAEALVPEFPVCPACAEVRDLGRGEWFCPPHRQPAERLYERLGR